MSNDPVCLNDRTGDRAVRFSICTMVTDHREYAEMVRSMQAGGFDGPDCEYLYLDNSNSNAFDAYQGYNLFLNEAQGTYIILCHQDILLLQDSRGVLEKRLRELDRQDAHWGLCGNAGARSDGRLVKRITDPHQDDQNLGPFPSRVVALDENFIIVRRDANLAVSHDLAGFHMYGADLCLISDILGRSAYVIDFHLLHKSGGSLDRRFYAVREAFMRKYSRAFRPRWIATTCTFLFIAPSYRLSRSLTKLLGFRMKR